MNETTEMSETQRLHAAAHVPPETPGTLSQLDYQCLRAAIPANHVIGTAALIVRKHVEAAQARRA